MDNTRGIILMTAAMAGFALEDSFIKLSAEDLGVGPVVVIFGLAGTLIFSALTARAGQPVLTRHALTRLMGLRALSEIIGRAGYFLGITLSALSNASIILQATPLVVSLGAVVFFGEKVGPRRWIAMGIGFLGVVLVLRPGLSGFTAGSAFALIGMLGFAGRDLATRAAPPVLSNLQLGVYGFAVMVPVGFVLSIGGPAPTLPTGLETLGLLAAIVSGVSAYYALTAAMRVGEIGVVAPFRYTRLLFALILGVGLFGERLDSIALLGAALIVAPGIYLITHERRRA